MASSGLHILLCMSAIVATVLSHALPTEDTFVITTSDGRQSVTETSTSDLTTDEPDPPIKVAEMNVRSEITMRYAHTAIVTRVQNPGKRAQESTFRVLLPETAFISGFVMTIDGKSYKAYVKGKEEAKNIYNQAVSQGYGAAHISAKARDSNVFTVSINIEGKSVVLFNLTYEELLTRKNGVYNHAVNLHPGTVVPKLTVVVHIKETQTITELRVPEVRTGNEVDATEEDAQNKNAVIERGAKNREATITFTPDLEEQKRLIQIYKEKSKERRPDRYDYSNDEQKSQDGILGQFVVQYDVDRSKGSDILVNDGYFVHFFAPTSLPPLSKHVVFVLDISGSMIGRKIVQLIAAMNTILEKLNKGDVFNIVQFESSVQVLDVKSATKSMTPVNRDYSFYREDSNAMPTLLPPVEATPENIEKAKILVSGLRAGGGTNIGTALDVAIALIQKGSKTSNSVETTTVSQNDEPQTNNTEGKVETNNVAKVAEEKTEDKVAEKEPIVIFLTDGDPTVGETSTTRIIKVVAEKNYGKLKASIFSLAFGEDADRNFLRKLSLKNDGFMRHIYEASDASLQLRDFYRQISSPLLADVKFTYPPDQVKEGSLTKSKFRRFYAGSEAIVAGRVQENVGELSPHIYGICGVGIDDEGRKPYEVTPKAPVGHGRESYLPLERLWAYLTIQQLLDERHITDLSDTDENSPAKKALELALKYEFVTELTSLVVVKPNATSAVDAESADKESSNYYPALPSSGLSAPHRAFSMAAPLSGYSHAYAFAPGYPSASAGFAHHSYPIALSGMPSPVADRMEYFYQEEEDDDALQLRPIAFGGMPSPLAANSYNRAESYYPDEEDDGRSHFYVRSMLSGRRRKYRLPKMKVLDSIPTTQAPSTSPTSNSLEEYRLNDFPWTESLLNISSDCISLQVNGTQVDLKLSKEQTLPAEASGDAECSNATETATDNATGLCVYLTRCYAARNITADIYSRTYCVVGDSFAGVCCPRNEVDKTP